MDCIAISNHKGGVGKSATTHALGAALGEMGRRVLLIDIDPQSSLTGACGVEAEGQSLAEVLGGATPGNLAMTDIIRDLGGGVSLAPADIALAVVELALASRLGRENVLKKAIAPVEELFDLCLIDTPPSLSLLTINALTAADSVLIPTMPQASDLRGLRLFWNSIDRVRAELNPDLAILGIVVTFYDPRLTHHNDAISVMEQAGLPVLNTRIGRSVRVAEAAATGESVVGYDRTGKRSQEYQRLAVEVFGHGS
jgi:chromosome partitioning protein